jgi:glycosyltransferase involved in cell wall biosynthesis
VTRPLVSIVTPSLNQRPFVERTLESILSQRGDFELELLVQDGGSTDGTLEVLERYGNSISLVVERDAGQADAVNRGLSRARGDILGWVNSDDVLRPGAVQSVVEAFRANPSAPWLHGRCDIVDGEDRIIRRPVAAYKDYRSRRHRLDRLLLENYVSQMTVFWRRSLQERVGLLDPSLRYTFDYDLWLRFSRIAPPLFLERTLAAFRWHPTSKSGSSFEAQFAEDHLVFLRHAPPGNLLRLRKRLRTAQILSVYRVLRALRPSIRW